jgi:hypothetical protein
VVGHPMIAALATDARFRRVAAAEGLGTMLVRGFTWDTAKNWQVLDEVLDKWAEGSKHPELRGAPVLTSGLSASVLMARLLVYERPERCFGIIHVAGGNLHHNYPEGKTLSGVPFMAVNGEFESCGPDGGIRPHLGFDTQWYLMGEQLLELRRQDPNHLMSLVVIPGRGHTAWNQALAALFIRKAAQYRISKEKRDGATPAKCVQLKAEDGWLTDRNVKYPKHEPAPYNEYRGEKGQAFWHLDKEMALAVCQYHKDGIRPGQGASLFRPAGLFEELWPLPERMDVPFKGHSPEEYAAAITEWIGKKAKTKLDAEVVRYLAQGIAAGLKKDKEDKAVDEGVCRERCQRVLYAYDDAFRPVDEALGKAKLPAESKALLRAHYAEQLLVLWPNKRATVPVSIRGIEAWIAGLPADSGPETIKAKLQDTASQRAAMQGLYGAAAGTRPENVDKLLEDLRHKDSKVGWGAVDELAKLGAAAILDLVLLLDYAGQPLNFRAAAALGKMGKTASCALPDLRRAALRGCISEMEATISSKALEAIAEIEKGGQP